MSRSAAAASVFRLVPLVCESLVDGQKPHPLSHVFKHSEETQKKLDITVLSTCLSLLILFLVFYLILLIDNKHVN